MIVLTKLNVVIDSGEFYVYISLMIYHNSALSVFFLGCSWFSLADVSSASKAP
jgi:hypothetical protein